MDRPKRKASCEWINRQIKEKVLLSKWKERKNRQIIQGEKTNNRHEKKSLNN